MQIDFLILADAAEVVNNKLYMMGGAWNAWRSSSYPAQVRMGIALGILVDWDETNERHPISLSILDEDGQVVVPEITAQVEVGRPPGITPGTSQRALLAINAGFALKGPGRYELRAVTGQAAVERRVPFQALLQAGPTVQLQ